MAKKEVINRVGLADNRSGTERLAAAVNRVTSGNRNAPVRKMDDSPAELAAKVRESKARRTAKRKR